MSVTSIESRIKHPAGQKRKGQELSEVATTYAKYRRVVVFTSSGENSIADGEWHTQYIRKPMPAVVTNTDKRRQEVAEIELSDDEDELDRINGQQLNQRNSTAEGDAHSDICLPAVVAQTIATIEVVSGTSVGDQQQQDVMLETPSQMVQNRQTERNSTEAQSSNSELRECNENLKQLLSQIISLKEEISKCTPESRINSLNANQQAEVSSSNTLRSISVVDLSVEKNDNEESGSTTIDLTESYATTTDGTTSTKTPVINPVDTLETNDTQVTIVLDNNEVEEEREVYPKLTKDHKAVIKRALYRGPQSEIIIKKFNINITRHDLTTLVRCYRLNDEVINFYMKLLIERSEQRADDLPRVYAMSTFFIPKLLSAGHAGLKRWTRKVNIFAYDLIAVPVHVEPQHWCMAIVDLKNQAIRYYDSNGIPNNFLLDVLEQYLRDESLDKRKQPFDTGNFVKENMRDCPRQQNDVDCGVFSCMFAEHEARNRKIRFSQRDIPYFRQKMIYEIAEGRLLT